MSTQENTELTKEYITQALFALMESEPYEGITITAIAKKAGVGRATFYRYFMTKEDIIRDHFTRQMQDFTGAFVSTGMTEDDIYEQIFSAFQILKKQKDVFRRLIDAHLEQFYIDFLNEQMAKYLRENDQQEMSVLPYHIAGSLYNVSLAWVKRDCRESVRYMADEYFKLLLHHSKGGTQ